MEGQTDGVSDPDRVRQEIQLHSLFLATRDEMAYLIFFKMAPLRRTSTGRTTIAKLHTAHLYNTSTRSICDNITRSTRDTTPLQNHKALLQRPSTKRKLKFIHPLKSLWHYNHPPRTTTHLYSIPASTATAVARTTPTTGPTTTHIYPKNPPQTKKQLPL